MRNFTRHMKSRMKSNYIHSQLGNYKSTTRNQTPNPQKANNDFLMFMVAFAIVILGILSIALGR